MNRINEKSTFQNYVVGDNRRILFILSHKFGNDTYYSDATVGGTRPFGDTGRRGVEACSIDYRVLRAMIASPSTETWVCETLGWPLRMSQYCYDIDGQVVDGWLFNRSTQMVDIEYIPIDSFVKTWKDSFVFGRNEYQSESAAAHKTNRIAQISRKILVSGSVVPTRIYHENVILNFAIVMLVSVCVSIISRALMRYRLARSQQCSICGYPSQVTANSCCSECGSAVGWQSPLLPLWWWAMRRNR